MADLPVTKSSQEGSERQSICGKDARVGNAIMKTEELDMPLNSVPSYSSTVQTRPDFGLGDLEDDSTSPFHSRRVHRIMQHHSFNADASRIKKLPPIDWSLFKPVAHDVYKISTVPTVKCDICHGKGQPEVYQCQGCTAQICKKCVEEKIAGPGPFDWVGDRHNVFPAAYLGRKAKGDTGGFVGMGVKIVENKIDNEIDVSGGSVPTKRRSTRRTVLDNDEHVADSDRTVSGGSDQSVCVCPGPCDCDHQLPRDPVRLLRPDTYPSYRHHDLLAWGYSEVPDASQVASNRAPATKSKGRLHKKRKVEDMSTMTSQRSDPFVRIPSARWEALVAATIDAAREEGLYWTPSDSDSESDSNSPGPLDDLEYQKEALSRALRLEDVPPLVMTNGVDRFVVPAGEIKLKDMRRGIDTEVLDYLDAQDDQIVRLREGWEQDPDVITQDDIEEAERYRRMTDIPGYRNTDVLAAVSTADQSDDPNDEYHDDNDENIDPRTEFEIGRSRSAIAQLAAFEAAQGWDNSNGTRTAEQAEAFLNHVLQNPNPIPVMVRQRPRPRNAVSRTRRQVAPQVGTTPTPTSTPSPKRQKTSVPMLSETPQEPMSQPPPPVIALEANNRGPWTKRERQQLWMADMDEVARLIASETGRRRSF